MCILLDMNLKTTNGFDVQNQLAQKGIQVPVIFLTGYGSIPMSVRAIKAGAHEFLTKPVDDDELLEAVRRALAQDEANLAERAFNADVLRRAALLTPREMDVFELAVEGRMIKQMAHELGTQEVGAIGVLAAMSFVCIVDDDASVRSGVGNLLKSAGYTTVTFSSGEEFLASPLIDDALCVLLDVRMQGMQGLEVQRQLKAEHRRIPVVFMSAHGDDDIVQRAMQHGAVSFLRKPFEEEVLLDSLELATGRRNWTD
ncbi:hypothetical protein KCU90_g3799, partial [Aureobasidium melanogenum]